MVSGYRFRPWTVHGDPGHDGHQHCDTESFEGVRYNSGDNGMGHSRLPFILSNFYPILGMDR